MSQENVEIVRESIRRFRPSGLDEWAELWHQDTRMTVPEGWPEPGPFIGLDAVKRDTSSSVGSKASRPFDSRMWRSWPTRGTG
jgi:ketosteroid isomerase-like protein